MPSIGGDLLEATFNHPTLGTGRVFFKANEDGQFDLGGFRRNDDANMVSGDGGVITQLNQVRWKVEGTVAWDMNTREDLTTLTELAGNPVDSDWTFSHKNGTVWAGKGNPVGDLSGNTNQATFSVTWAGGGGLKRQ